MAKYEGLLAETVTYPGDGGDVIRAYMARPLGSGPYPGVIVIHHMPGWDEATKEITRRFAHHGYVAVCPNLHYREAPDAEPDDAELPESLDELFEALVALATVLEPESTTSLLSSPLPQLAIIRARVESNKAVAISLADHLNVATRK